MFNFINKWNTPCHVSVHPPFFTNQTYVTEKIKTWTSWKVFKFLFLFHIIIALWTNLHTYISHLKRKKRIFITFLYQLESLKESQNIKMLRKSPKNFCMRCALIYCKANEIYNLTLYRNYFKVKRLQIPIVSKK